MLMAKLMRPAKRDSRCVSSSERGSGVCDGGHTYRSVDAKYPESQIENRYILLSGNHLQPLPIRSMVVAQPCSVLRVQGILPISN